MSDEAKPTSRPVRPTRRLDARGMRGLGHPLRMSIFELLDLDGPATATQLARRLGENTGTVSWHLRHLAEHDFIEEETGRGTKRERWWRKVEATIVLDSSDFRNDPAARKELPGCLNELVKGHFSRVTEYFAESWDGPWRGIGTVSREADMRMTPAQLESLINELMAVIDRHAPDPAAETGPDTLPVVVQFQAFPRKERDSM